jgi:cell division protein FtsW
MMRPLARTDTSALSHWWWTVDRWMLAGLVVLMAVGILLTLAASPAVAERLGLDSFHFVRRQLAVLPLAIALMFGASMANPRQVLRIALVVLLLVLPLMVLALTHGPEVKGARRWIAIGGASLQPSELVKPAFAVVAAWLFTLPYVAARVPGSAWATALFGLVMALLLLQPDLGMALVVAAIWFTQFFLAGLSMVWVGLFVGLGLCAMALAYFNFPHVASRIDRFLDPSAGDSYQVNRSLEAFTHGGVFGVGPGEGTVKAHLPDAHADFIFAVAGEEFGLIPCLLIVALFAVLVMRGFSRAQQAHSPFVVLAAAGLLVQFGLQAVINMASTLHLIPTKGMTLPFVSYGGSSLLGLGLGMGLLLALTRRRADEEVWL